MKKRDLAHRPACTEEQGEYFGRLRVMAPLDPERELEVRHRVWNIEARTRHTQPERRALRIDRTPAGLEILTTSPKLAHRLARELEKAFGGRTQYTWTDSEDALDATWYPPVSPSPALAVRPTPHRPRIKQRSMSSP